MEKTKDLSIFKHRSDNRDENKKIDWSHVERLITSIKSCNMLHLRPIIVNEQMEILDGQHRTEAARKLGLEIWYEVREEFKPTDIIKLNVQKNWTMSDYFNFYEKNKYPEYVKLREFAKKHGLESKVVIQIMCGGLKESRNAFKDGEFKFVEKKDVQVIDVVKDCIEVIKLNTGTRFTVNSRKVWVALYKLVSDPKFVYDQFKRNVEKLSDRMAMKATQQETYEHLVSVFNYKNSNRIEVEV